jgi:uncharacterized protein with NAD-binding domain and iron-sulfur cluster
LITQSSAWANMVNCVKTVRTTDIQTWMNQDLAQLGWTRGRTIGLTGVEPVDMIADATEIVDFENWPADAPRNLTFFGGPMPNDPKQPTPPDPAYPPTQHQIAQQIGEDYLNKYAGIFWPKSMTGTGFNWSLVTDKYYHANIDPSERYVLSVVNSTQYRLEAGNSGFDHLFLAGDWIKNGLNSGCMEATIMSGMQVSRAISGFPARIIGENDFGVAEASGPVVVDTAAAEMATGK